MIFLGEFVIAGIVAGNPENRAGAIIHQHEIGDVDRQSPVGIERVDDLDAGVEAALFGGLDLGSGGPAQLAFGDEFGGVRIGRGDRGGQRMAGGNRDKARAENRVGAGREHLDLAERSDWCGQLEPKLQPAALADPILLHQPDLVGPLVEVREAVEQLLGEVGDLQKPLRQLAPLDRRARPPALAIDHLLIGEHGHVDRIPIDLALLAINQAGFVQVEEQRLLVAVIIGLAGGELAAPVEREAEPFQLLAHRRDIGAGPAAGMDPLLHRRILGWHAERVPAHRVEHFHALHPAVAGEDVAHRVIADMAHVDAPRRIGEHLQHIGLGLGACAVGGEALRLVPPRLPARVGLPRVEAAGHREHAF